VAADVPAAATITRTETSGPPYDPTIVDVPYACSGWLDQYAAHDVDGTRIRVDDRRAFILCSSLTITPTTADTLTVDGSTFSIIAIQRDPAGTAWVVQCRT
jgi:hypothetical protein